MIRRRSPAFKIPVLLMAVLFLFGTTETFAQCEIHEDTKLTASDAAQGEAFGKSVSVSGDVAIVGAIYDHCGDGLICGSGHIYRFHGSTWVEEQKLTASDRSLDLDHFGHAVSVSGDVAVIGAYLRNCSVGQFCGSAYVYRFNGSTWIQEQKLTAPNAAERDYFGISVSVDGSVIVVGASGRDCAPGSNCGSAYVYRYNGITWVQQLRLTASDAASNDLFGISVTVSGDTVVVGAFGDDCAAGINCGSAYVYRFNGSTWVEEQRLTASDAAQQDLFGVSVSVVGNVSVVGAYQKDCPAGQDCGSAYVYRFNGSNWVEEGKLTASDAAPDDQFGYSVSVSGDTVVVGAFLKDCAGGQDCGSAYVYRFDGDRWVDQGKLAASDAAPGDQFSGSVSVSGELAVAGAAFDDCRDGIECGSAYVFRVGGLPLPADCNTNGIADECDIADCTSDPGCADCNSNEIPDGCDIASGTSADCNGDGIPDECDELLGFPLRGACCDHNNFGSCTDGVSCGECSCPQCEWTKLASCSDVECLRESIPTVGAWGLAILTLLLLTGAKLRFGLRPPVPIIRNS